MIYIVALRLEFSPAIRRGINSEWKAFYHCLFTRCFSGLFYHSPLKVGKNGFNVQKVDLPPNFNRLAMGKYLVSFSSSRVEGAISLPHRFSSCLFLRRLTNESRISSRRLSFPQSMMFRTYLRNFK